MINSVMAYMTDSSGMGVVLKTETANRNQRKKKKLEGPTSATAIWHIMCATFPNGSQHASPRTELLYLYLPLAHISSAQLKQANLGLIVVMKHCLQPAHMCSASSIASTSH